MSTILSVLALLTACSGGEQLTCPDAAHVLDEHPTAPLTCGDAAKAEAYVELLASRPLTAPQERNLRAALIEAHRADLAAARARLDRAEVAAAALGSDSGPPAGVEVSRATWAELQGSGPLASGSEALLKAVRGPVAACSTTFVPSTFTS